MNVIAKSILVAVAALSVAACSGSQQQPPSPGAAAAASAAPAAPVATVPTDEAAAAPPVIADGDFGVPECDEYFRKYYACINSKVPESARAIVKQSIDQTRAQWKQTASTPAGRTALADGCRQATAAARQAVAAYGCTW